MKSCTPEGKPDCCAYHKYLAERKWNKLMYPPILKGVIDWIDFTKFMWSFSQEIILTRLSRSIGGQLAPTIVHLVENLMNKREVISDLRKKAEDEDHKGIN